MTRMIYHLIYGKALSSIVMLIASAVLLWFLAAFLAERYRKNKIWIWINRAAMLAALATVVGVTICSRSETEAEMILMPFSSFVEARIQPEMYRSMLMNVFLFVPLGLAMPFALPQKWKHRALFTVLFACVLSVGIEYLQYRLSLGRCETDDVICNTFGAFLGTLSFQAWCRMKLWFSSKRG